jgi:hypothetical protein
LAEDVVFPFTVHALHGVLLLSLFVCTVSS